MQFFSRGLRRPGPIAAIGAGALLLGMIAASAPLSAAEPNASKPGLVIFVCKYGSMKSQMAAAYFNRLAKENGIQLTAVSRSWHPDKEIPQMIIDNLAKEGLAPTNEISLLTPGEASTAARIISFDEIPTENIGESQYTYWAGSPLSKKDYWGAMAFIKKHVNEEVGQMVSTKSADVGRSTQ